MSGFLIHGPVPGAPGLFDPAFLRVVELAGVAQFGEGLDVLGQTGADDAFMLGFGVDLGHEQDRDVGDPQPDQENDHGGERSVGLVVRAGEADVDGEQPGGDHPEDDGEDAASRYPPEGGLPDVRAGLVEQREHHADDDHQYRPFRDIPDQYRSMADPEGRADLVRDRSGQHHDRGGDHEHDDKRDRGEQPDRAGLPDRAALVDVVDGVRGAHEGRDIARSGPHGDHQADDPRDPGRAGLALDLSDDVRQERVHPAGGELAEVAEHL